MKISLIIIISLQIASAKISGGPRGRFDKNGTRKYTNNNHVTAHHYHYSYHPPSKIYYMCRQCTNFASYPVYHGSLPTYVYKYRESGGRFSSMLAGLALYNLGRAATEHWEYTRFYMYRRNENCSMQVVDRKHFEEIGFPCFIMSSFVDRSPESFIPGPNALDITSPLIDIRPFLHYNGSLLKVTREQDCILWHNTTEIHERKVVPCVLLREYAETMKPSGVPVYVWLPTTLATVILIYISCQCCCKKKVKNEEAPFNKAIVVGYCSNVY